MSAQAGPPGPGGAPVPSQAVPAHDGPDRAVELELPATAEHVRTARLVSVAVARRMGLDDQLVEEVRLAVGEACARHLARADTPSRLRLELREHVPGRPGLHVVVRALGAGEAPAPAPADDLSLAVLQNLVPELSVGASRLDLHWPR